MFWRYHWPALLWAIFVLILCGYPGNKLPELTFLEWLKPDKIMHIVLFGIQCFLLLKGLHRKSHSLTLKKNFILTSIILSISYGILVEVLQEYIFINRNGDLRDAIANSLGALAGYWIFKRKFQKAGFSHN
jgi:VanZ family protein